jgi:hypothetical protein
MEPAFQRRSFSAGRRWGILLSVLVSTAAVVAIVLMVNYLGARHFERYRWSAQGGQKLSPLTTGLLRSITNDVTVMLYFQRSDALYSDIADLLKEYQHENPRISWQTVDYVADAVGAQKVKLTYGLGADKDRVILDCGKKTPVIIPGDLFGRASVTMTEGGPTDATGKRTPSFEKHYTQFSGESLLDGALLTLTSDRRLLAGYVRGHGEPDLDGQGALDYAELNDVLVGCNLQTTYLTLTGTNQIPAACNLLIIAGPTSALSADEVRKVRTYLAGGGRLLMLYTYALRGRQTGLEPLLAEWGVDVGDNYVTDQDNDIAAPGGADKSLPIIWVNHFNPKSDLISPLLNSRIYMYVPRSIGARRTSGDNVPTVEELARTGPRGVIHYNTGGAVATPGVPLMVSVEKKTVRAGIDSGVTRIVVAGDSLFLGNVPMNSAENANGDFAHLAVNWLLEQTTMMQNVGPRRMVEYKLVMTQAQMRSVRWIFMGALPGGILALGGLVWLRRRR